MRLFTFMPLSPEIKGFDNQQNWVEGPSSGYIGFPSLGVSRNEQALQDSLPIITTTVDSNGKFTFAISPIMEKNLGYPKTLWDGNPYHLWNSILHPEDKERVYEEYNHAPKDGEPRVLEYRLIAKDGKSRWIRETTQLKKSLILQTTLCDVTEEKKHSVEITTLQRTAELFSSRLSLDEIMDTVRREIKHIVPYRTANVMLVEEDQYGKPMIKIAYAWGYDEEKVPQPEIKSIPLDFFPTLEEIYNNPGYMIINDTSKDARWRFDGATRNWVKSWLATPLRYKGKVIGFINYNSPEKNTYTNDHAKFLQAIADQVGTAIDNSRKDLQLEKQAEELKDLSFRDGLTGLPNTRAWNKAIENEEARFNHTKRPYSVLVIDCNRFKYINDNFTHPVGDTVLKTIAQFLQQTIRRQNFDFVARPNDQGDEFYILLPETNNEGAGKVEEFILDQAYQQIPILLLEAIGQNHTRFEQDFKKFIDTFVENKLPLISIGYATKENQTTSLQVIEIADAAMNYFKRSFNLIRES